MDYNLAPYLILHFSQAINDELEGLKGLPTQLGIKKTKNLDALMSLIWWCLLYSNGKNDIIVRYLKKKLIEIYFWILEISRRAANQNVPNIQNKKIPCLLYHCDIVLIFEIFIYMPVCWMRSINLDYVSKSCNSSCNTTCKQLKIVSLHNLHSNWLVVL